MMRLLLLFVTLVSLFLFSIDAVRLRSLPSPSRHAIPTKKHAIPRSTHLVEMINPENHLVNDANKPQQIVTGMTNIRGELMISWLTFAPSNKPVIRYQSPHQGTPIYASARSDSFLDPQSGHILRYIHTGKLTNLIPRTNYSYIVGDSQDNIWSDPLYFITIPPGDEIVRLGIYGDLGLVNSQSLRYLNEEVILNRTIDAMLQIGDFAYDLHTDNGTLGDAWMNMMQNMTSLVPFMGCPGNHESRYNFTHFMKRFAIWDEAGIQTKSGFNWWYSWDYQSGGATVHMVSINTEVYYNNHGELPTERAAQYAWLDSDFSAARSRGVDWLIVYGHRPMYCSNIDDLPDCSIDATTLRDGWLNPKTGEREYGMEALFGKYKVDIYFTAHEHSYERTYPVYQGIIEHHDPDLFVNPTKPIHIIAGSAGCKEGMEYFDNVFYGPWSIIRSSTYGYGHLLVHNKTHLYWDQLLAEGDAGKDIMWIVKGDTPSTNDSSNVSRGAAAGIVVGIIVSVILGYCCWTTWYNSQIRKMRVPSIQGRAPLLLNQ